MNHSYNQYVGAPCGPYEYWDETQKSCVQLSLPLPQTGPVPHCPPGQFFDYLRQSCVSSSVAPHATSGLGDVTVGPHLISPLGWPYAWGQALGLWGGRDAPAQQQPMYRDDDRRAPYDRGGGSGSPDWKTVALVGIGVAGVVGLGYLLLRRDGGGRPSRRGEYAE